MKRVSEHVRQTWKTCPTTTTGDGPRLNANTDVHVSYTGHLDTAGVEDSSRAES